jgi:hypothetical protein
LIVSRSGTPCSTEPSDGVDADVAAVQLLVDEVRALRLRGRQDAGEPLPVRGLRGALADVDEAEEPAVAAGAGDVHGARRSRESQQLPPAEDRVLEHYLSFRVVAFECRERA